MISNIIEILVVFYLASLTIGYLLTLGGGNASDKTLREDEKVPE